MESGNGVQRDLGSLEARVDALQHTIDEIKDQVRENTVILTEMQGGKKYLFALFGLAAMVGALADKMIGWLH